MEKSRAASGVHRERCAAPAESRIRVLVLNEEVALEKDILSGSGIRSAVHAHGCGENAIHARRRDVGQIIQEGALAWILILNEQRSCIDSSGQSGIRRQGRVEKIACVHFSVIDLG